MSATRDDVSLWANLVANQVWLAVAYLKPGFYPVMMAFVCLLFAGCVFYQRTKYPGTTATGSPR